MPKFKLTCVDEDGSRTTKKFESIFLDETVGNVADFLRGAGYIFDELEVRNDYGTERNDDGEDPADPADLDTPSYYLAEELLCDH